MEILVTYNDEAANTETFKDPDGHIMADYLDGKTGISMYFREHKHYVFIPFTAIKKVEHFNYPQDEY